MWDAGQRKRDSSPTTVPASGFAGVRTSRGTPRYFARSRCYLADELRVPAFSQSEIGLYKSVALANHRNFFWGPVWDGFAERLDTKRRLDGADIFVGRVDTPAAPAAIAKCAAAWSEIDCWPDLGNSADRAVCTRRTLNRRNRRYRLQLRAVSELLPEVIRSDLDEDSLPPPKRSTGRNGSSIPHWPITLLLC